MRDGIFSIVVMAAALAIMILGIGVLKGPERSFTIFMTTVAALVVSVALAEPLIQKLSDKIRKAGERRKRNRKDSEPSITH
jgi:SNF family Na+-dependent transporter